MAAQAPSREYIHLGGRVIAIESPAAPPTTTRYTLSVVASGASNLNVTITPNSACTQNTGGSSSGSTAGTATCDAGTPVQISAPVAPPLSQFVGWTGGVAIPSDLQTTVTMNGDKR